MKILPKKYCPRKISYETLLMKQRKVADHSNSIASLSMMASALAQTAWQPSGGRRPAPRCSRSVLRCRCLTARDVALRQSRSRNWIERVGVCVSCSCLCLCLCSLHRLGLRHLAATRFWVFTRSPNGEYLRKQKETCRWITEN